jgi:pyruvate,water dikinase
MNYIIPLDQLRLKDAGEVGGKNAALGELISGFSSKGISVPDGIALTTDAFNFFIEDNNLTKNIQRLFQSATTTNTAILYRVSATLKRKIKHGILSEKLKKEIHDHLEGLRKKNGPGVSFSVRSSATYEDDPKTSFAGLHDSFLNLRQDEEIMRALVLCYASLCNQRALFYRNQHKIPHQMVKMAVVIQVMVQADKAPGCSGVCFSIDPDSGFQNVLVIQSNWGLGESVVKGLVDPDEFTVFKPFLYSVTRPLISRKLGSKEKFTTSGVKGKNSILRNNSQKLRLTYTLTEDEVLLIAKWADMLERHFKWPVDMEWVKDQESGKIFIVQVRPETVHGSKKKSELLTYELSKHGALAASGVAVGYGVASGRVRVLSSIRNASQLRPGEILYTKSTTPDWDPLFKKASAVITERGGRTSHAAIVARELCALAVVGTGDVSSRLKNGEEITIDNTGSIGKVYRGRSSWKIQTVKLDKIPSTQVLPQLILGDPDQAYYHSFLPSKGVGLLRLEFIISGKIGIHPGALLHPKKIKDIEVRKQIKKRTVPFTSGRAFYLDKLIQNISIIASAFYPKSVLVRFSDFKSDEYVGLLGGNYFEADEENPMIGVRGAFRYTHPAHSEVFKMECETIKTIREELGFLNVNVMIPFCRTLKEAENTIELMKEFGLERGVRGLEVWMMCEVPSNVILAKEFLRYFDGFSIGSNDLTQLLLGVDRGNPAFGEVFNENDLSVRRAIVEVIQKAHKMNKSVGFCGQKPSDNPEFVEFLVNAGIDSISFNADALLRGINTINHAERKRQHNS